MAAWPKADDLGWDLIGQFTGSDLVNHVVGRGSDPGNLHELLGIRNMVFEGAYHPPAC